jgi:hypothetical protein
LLSNLTEMDKVVSDELEDEVENADDSVFPKAVYDILKSFDSRYAAVADRCETLGVEIEVRKLTAPEQ